MSVDGIIAEGRRTKRYADYVQQCAERGIPPASFRLFAEQIDEYDREWEVAGYEYERGVRGNDNE